ncbi:MAG: hypothetical protein Q7S68_05935, partial [Deltaproteobacteria bacterium]|nr:hypothetical protein [Deltaproteobacteria bacterium]
MKRLVLTISIFVFAASTAHAQLGGGNLNQQMRNNRTNIQVTAPTPAPPLPAGCRVENITNQCPATAINPQGQRTVCTGYFWGSSAVDRCTSEEIQTFGTGQNIETFNAIYLRFPTLTNSTQPFRKILIPTLETQRRLPQCGTHAPTQQELNEIIWGVGDTSFNMESILERVFVKSAHAVEDDSGNTTRRLWTPEEKIQAATGFGAMEIRLRRGIDAGEYGSPGSLPRNIVERLDYSIRWAIHHLNPANPSYPNVTGFLGDDSPPPIYFEDIEDWGDYTPEEIRIDIDIGQETAMLQTLAHELIHAANDALHFPTYDEEIDDPAEMLADEWLAEIFDKIIFMRSLNLQYPQDRNWVEDNYQTFLNDPYALMIQPAIDRADTYVQFLPREIFQRRENEYRNGQYPRCILEVELGYRDSYIDSDGYYCAQGNRAGNEEVRIYDVLFPNCSGTDIPDCPDPDRPREWPEEQRNRYNNFLVSTNADPENEEAQERRLIQRVEDWEPYIHKWVAEFEARGGLHPLYLDEEAPIANSNPLENSPGGLAPNYVFYLQYNNWLQGITGKAPQSPSGAPQDPGVGLGPQMGYNLPGASGGFPTQFTGQQENDPNWNEPPPSSEIEVPNNIRNWQSGNSDCGADRSAFDFCWAHFTYGQRQNAGPCRQMMERDLNQRDHQNGQICHCSTFGQPSSCSNGSPCFAALCNEYEQRAEEERINQVIQGSQSGSEIGGTETGSGSNGGCGTCPSGTVCRNGYCETDASQFGCAGGSCPSGAGGSNG